MAGLEDEMNLSLSYLANTALGPYIAVAIVAYALIGAFWAGLFSIIFPYLYGDLIFASSLSAIDIVIGFVYFMWLRSQMDGYASGIRDYRTGLAHIEVSADKLVGFVNLEGELKQLRKDPPVGLEERGRTVVEVAEHMVNLKCCLQFLAFHYYRVFAPANRDMIVSKSPAARDDALDDALYVEPMSELEEGLSTVSCQTFLSNVPDELLDYQDRYSDPIKLSHALRRYLFREYSHLNRPGFDLGQIHASLTSLTDALISIEVARSYREPTIFAKHMQLILITYFGIWMPITLWVRFGFLWTILIYTVVMFILTGPWIYRKYLGDAFSPTRPVVVAQHKKWRDDAVLDLDEVFSYYTK